MKAAPAPDLLHRVAIRDTKLGTHDIRSGDRLVLGIGSAARDEPGKARLLFGGDYKGAKTVTAHACPGQEMAWGVMLGVIATLLSHTRLQPETGRLKLRLATEPS
jgi:cytochrome P450